MRVQTTMIIAAFALGSAVAFADDTPKNSPQRQAFLAGSTKDCPGCDLRGVRLKRRDLSGADLTGADLSDAVLHAAKLTNAKLVNANLQNANGIAVSKDGKMFERDVSGFVAE